MADSGMPAKPGEGSLFGRIRCAIEYGATMDDRLTDKVIEEAYDALRSLESDHEKAQHNLANLEACIARRGALEYAMRHIVAASPGTPDSVKKYLVRTLEGSWGEPYEQAMTVREIARAIEIGPPDFLLTEEDNVLPAECAHDWTRCRFEESPHHVRVCNWCGLGECRDNDDDEWRFYTQLVGEGLRPRP